MYRLSIIHVPRGSNTIHNVKQVVDFDVILIIYNEEIIYLCYKIDKSYICLTLAFYIIL